MHVLGVVYIIYIVVVFIMLHFISFRYVNYFILYVYIFFSLKINFLNTNTSSHFLNDIASVHLKVSSHLVVVYKQFISPSILVSIFQDKTIRFVPILKRTILRQISISHYLFFPNLIIFSKI